MTTRTHFGKDNESIFPAFNVLPNTFPRFYLYIYLAYRIFPIRFHCSTWYFYIFFSGNPQNEYSNFPYPHINPIKLSYLFHGIVIQLMKSVSFSKVMYTCKSSYWFEIKYDRIQRCVAAFIKIHWIPTSVVTSKCIHFVNACVNPISLFSLLYTRFIQSFEKDSIVLVEW